MATLADWNQFLEKMEWEGGVEGMLSWGGPECFPAEIRSKAEQVQSILKELEDACEFKRQEIELDDDGSDDYDPSSHWG